MWLKQTLEADVEELKWGSFMNNENKKQIDMQGLNVFLETKF